MTNIVVYPVPNETREVWEEFRPFVERFAYTLKEFPPGLDCKIAIVCFGNYKLARIGDLFQLAPALCVNCYDYKGAGMDIGSAQWFADNYAGDAFLTMMTTRCYFHRAGWLRKIVEAREQFGRGLYGVSASREGGLHICTRAYSMDAQDFRAYPHEIISRDQGAFFEVGAGNVDGPLSQWFLTRGNGAYVVNWDGVRPIERFDEAENCFRKGNQSNCLVFDKHTDIFKDASPEEKERLTEITFGLAPAPIST